MKKLLVALLMVLGIQLAEAQQMQRNHPGVGREQRQRIHQGVRSGELRKGESKRLHKEQRQIHRMKRNAAADGRVGPRERQHIQQAQRHADRSIYRMKHNNRKAI